MCYQERLKFLCGVYGAINFSLIKNNRDGVLWNKRTRNSIIYRHRSHRQKLTRDSMSIFDQCMHVFGIFLHSFTFSYLSAYLPLYVCFCCVSNSAFDGISNCTQANSEVTVFPFLNMSICQCLKVTCPTTSSCVCILGLQLVTLLWKFVGLLSQKLLFE